jgi:YD repeat-containing protein
MVVGPGNTHACRPNPNIVTQTLARKSDLTCPAGYIENPQNTQQCICPPGKEYVAATDSCKVVVTRNNQDDSSSCKAGPGVGRPIFPATGSKRTEIQVTSTGLARLSLTYDSRRRGPSNKLGVSLAFSGAPSFGALWESSLHRALTFDSSHSPSTVQAWRGSGRMVTFNKVGTNFKPNVSVSDQLVRSGTRWHYYDREAGTLEVYGDSGQLLSLSNAGGRSVTFVYSDANTPSDIAIEPGLLVEVRDESNRVFQFKYDAPVGWGLRSRVRSAVTPNQYETKFTYDPTGRLTSVVWPDATSRTLLYENSTFSWALTGVLDELSKRVNTVSYDASGRAYETRAVGEVDHYKASWTTPPSLSLADTYDSTLDLVSRDIRWVAGQGTSVQGPNQAASTLDLALVDGMPRVVGASQPAGSGCAASSSAIGYDANGNIASKDDFNGNRTCYVHDLSRNLETARVEGLAAGAACAVTSSGAQLPAGSRKSSSQWHPDWPLRTKHAEPGRTTTYIYNGQPDPFSGTTASCAPAAATLPDGKPLAVLCRQVEQATTDADGSLGFAASLQPGVANRERSWTYDAQGRVLTEIERPGSLTTYTYYQSTSFTGSDPNAVGYSVGNLQSVTRVVSPATSLTTTYTHYDKLGNWLQMMDPNGVATVRTFDARQRLRTSSTAGQTTTYDYWPTGLVKRVTQPDASWVAYDYDDAHRLVKVSDNLGNSVSYTLDNLGNREVDAVKDPSQALRRQVQRNIDTLGRIERVTGRE